MSGFDGGRVYVSYQGQEAPRDPIEDGPGLPDRDIVEGFKQFIQSYQIGTTRDVQERRLYADDLYEHRSHLHVDLKDVRAAAPKLADALEERPSDVLPLFEEAARKVLQDKMASDEDGNPADVPEVQVLLYSSIPLAQSAAMSIRDLESSRVSKLVLLTGIITASSKPRHKATYLTVQCKTCRGTKRVACSDGMGGAYVPSYCDLANRRAPGAGGEDCGQNPYVILPEQSDFVDQQTLKLQEKPEDVPTGELPRTVMLVADRQNCGVVTPGTRVTITGIYSTFRGKAMDKGVTTLQQPYIRVVSVMQEAGDAHSRFKFTKEEIQQFEQFAKQDGLHEELFARIAPNIYGSDDIKKAVACLLFGGARKQLPDGTNRRGDINVLLLGDPSTAKSQFLKYVSRVAPIAVYTSGKGSSAAGLTATVVQDANSREFYLEGGAMVLADNGVVCIDEFDKMRPEDRVAIHEAMEQQTISIAKAGITTTLNSRCSVLAAANSVFGRWDDTKGEDNIDFMPTILSRFDMIFIIKDHHDQQRDMTLARHVMNVHLSAQTQTEGVEGEIPLATYKKYIAYARVKCGPRLSTAAAEKLKNRYVVMRSGAREHERESDKRPSIPITVRQLEAVVRIAESLAKMKLQAVAGEAEVDEALRLFQVSTLDAALSGSLSGVEGFTSQEDQEMISRIEKQLKRRFAIGSQVSEHSIVQDFTKQKYPEHAIYKVLHLMLRRGEMQHRMQRKVLYRVK